MRRTLLAAVVVVLSGVSPASAAEEPNAAEYFFAFVGMWKVQGDALYIEKFTEPPALCLNGDVVIGTLRAKPGDTLTYVLDGYRSELKVLSVKNGQARVRCREFAPVERARDHVVASTKARPRTSPVPLILEKEETVTLVGDSLHGPMLITSPSIAVEGSNGQGWRTR